MKGSDHFIKLKRRRSKGEDEAVKTRKTFIPEETNNDDDDDDDDDDDEENGGRVSHGYHLVEGKLGHSMEDYLVAKKKKMDGNNLALYSIFNHSGRHVANYLKNNLFRTILNQPNFWTETVTAVKRAYENMNEHILENIVGRHRGGSTAVTAILINGTKLIVANVGDSRAVLCMNDGEVRQITVDHHPLTEKHLVESKGGFVTQNKSDDTGNVARVDGQLAMTRAFGDAKIKDHITAEPDVFIEDLNINHTKYIILASDGLWKVMSNEEASECIKGFQDGKEAARKLIEEAVGRGSQNDVSCIVVVLH